MSMYKVLIVDDSPIIREGICRMLNWENLGFRIAGTAESGSAALKFLETQPCDLILTDIRMPDMDGIELIRRVRERGLDAETIIISAYREFEYAKEAMQLGVNHYLIKPISIEILTETVLILRTELQEEEKRRHRESERAMLKLLVDSSGIPQNGMESTIPCNCPYYCLALLHLNTLQEQMERLFGAREDEETFEEIVMNFLSPQVDCFVTSHAENRIAILFLPKNDDVQQLRILMSKLTEHLELYADISVRAVLGEVVSGIRELSGTYQRIVALISHERFWKQGETMAMVTGASDAWKAIPALEMSSLLNAVRTSKMDDVMQETEGLIDQLRMAHLPVSQLRMMLSEIMFKLTSVVMEINHDANRVLRPYDYHEQLYRISDADALFAYLRETMSKLCNSLNHAPEKNGQIHTSAVADYIREHYAENITAKSIAEKFYINPVYLGRLFARRQGVSLNKYVNNVRIENARLLLVETDMKVYAICSAVGYKSIKYFYQIFKEVTEMTPNEYRLLYGK